jgi:tight adherence protein C
MRELYILAGFFLVVMAGTGLLGYAALFRRQTDEETAGPLMETLSRIGRIAPVRPEESDRLRKRLGLAGYRSLSAAPVYSGIRIASAGLLGLVALGLAAYTAQSLYRGVLAALCAALVGFMLPQRVLSRWIRERSERLRDGLPTALDLMVLSLEAGQSLDAALIETSRELREPFPDLCAELSLVQLEIFASKSRAEALRNLATRNEELEIRRLAQVFIDSDRFGTSLAPALRMHVHYLRIRTRQKAQEAARKVGVKLVFPVFFLIFPAVLLVTVGPAVLLVVSQLGPMLTNAVP